MEKVRKDFPVTDEQPENNISQERPTPHNEVYDHDSDGGLFEACGLDLKDINKRWKKSLKKHRALPEGERTATWMVERISKKFTKKELAALVINETGEKADPIMRMLVGAMTASRK